MQTIDDILQGFRHKEARMEYAKEVYAKACSQLEVLRKREGVLIKTKPFFPETSVEAIESLLERLVKWHFKQKNSSSAKFGGWVTLLHGNYKFVLSPKVRANGKNLFNIYNSQMFGKFYSTKVLFDFGASDDMNVEASLDNTALKIVLFNPYKRKEFSFTLGELATGNYFKGMFVEHSSGVALRRTDEHGRFKVSCDIVNLTPENADKYVLVLFDNEKDISYHFNLLGRRMHTSLGPVRSHIQERLKKAAAIAEEMKSVDVAACSLSVADELKQRWCEEPLQFTGAHGWRYMISGNVEVPCRNGMVRSYHHQRRRLPNKYSPVKNKQSEACQKKEGQETQTSNRISTFNVAQSYNKPSVHMYFAGPYVVFMMVKHWSMHTGMQSQ